MKRILKSIRKATPFVLALVMSFSALLPVNASAVTAYANLEVLNFTFEDVMALEPYVYVVDGQFMLDVNGALLSGIALELITLQQGAFEALNQKSYIGEIFINDDLTIDTPYVAPIAFCSNFRCGGGVTTETETHWWGYSRYFCDFDSREFARILGEVAIGTAVASALTMKFPPLGVTLLLGTAYYQLLSSRITANNQGRGVHISMTWVQVFSIRAQ